MNLTEGIRVSYVGEGDEGLQIGDEGRILLRDDRAAHVQWLTGTRAGEIVLVDDLDLATSGRAQAYEDLDSGSLVSVPVQATLNRFGHRGLFEALADEGHLSSLQPAVDDAIGLVAATLRSDPSIVEVLSELGSEDGEMFVAYATYALLMEALRED